MAERQGWEIYRMVMLMVTGMLVVGCLAYRWLPMSPLLRGTAGQCRK